VDGQRKFLQDLKPRLQRLEESGCQILVVLIEHLDSDSLRKAIEHSPIQPVGWNSGLQDESAQRLGLSPRSGPFGNNRDRTVFFFSDDEDALATVPELWRRATKLGNYLGEWATSYGIQEETLQHPAADERWLFALFDLASSEAPSFRIKGNRYRLAGMDGFFDYRDDFIGDSILAINQLTELGTTGISVYDLAFVIEGDDAVARQRVKEWIDRKRITAKPIGKCPLDKRKQLYRLSELLSDVEKLLTLDKSELNRYRQALTSKLRAPTLS